MEQQRMRCGVLECIQSVSKPGRCSRSITSSSGGSCDGSYHIHTVYVALTGLYCLHHLLQSASHPFRHTGTHRHEQPPPCSNMTIANEAWQGASQQTSRCALPVWLPGLHYPSNPPPMSGKKQIIASTFSLATCSFLLLGLLSPFDTGRKGDASFIFSITPRSFSDVAIVNKLSCGCQCSRNYSEMFKTPKQV